MILTKTRIKRSFAKASVTYDSVAELQRSAGRILIKTIDAAKELKADIDVRIVWNRFRASTRSAQELSEAAHNELSLKELKNKLGYRVAYSEALARGMTVTEWTDKTAKSEMLSLGKEIEKLIKVKFIKD